MRLLVQAGIVGAGFSLDLAERGADKTCCTKRATEDGVRIERWQGSVQKFCDGVLQKSTGKAGQNMAQLAKNNGSKHGFSFQFSLMMARRQPPMRNPAIKPRQKAQAVMG
jgi:hypothetical protein